MSVDVQLREMGMRDGLQNVGTVLPTEAKKAWCTAEHAAGVREIEVCSFVPPKLVPQFADAAEVVAHALTLDGLTVAALVPNLKGAQHAVEAGVHKVNYVLSASEAHNRANVRRPLEESVDDFARIVDFVSGEPVDRRPHVTAGIATAFGCTIQGEVDEDHVVALAGQLAALGADEILLADTVGYGDPAKVHRLVTAVRAVIGDLPMGLHLHDTRGLGIANALAGWECGIRRFDASLGGLGGCQFAPGATGNVVMEDMVFMFESMGVPTGIDVEALMAIRGNLVEQLPDAAFEGALARAGLPKGYMPGRRRGGREEVSTDA